jgi:hypothetical protein
MLGYPTELRGTEFEPVQAFNDREISLRALLARIAQGGSTAVKTAEPAGRWFPGSPRRPHRRANERSCGCRQLACKGNAGHEVAT